MKLNKFIIGYCAVTVLLTALSLMSINAVTEGLWRSLINFVMLFAPLFMVWIAEGESLKKLCGQYLSFKRIDWKNAVLLIAVTALFFTLIPVVTVYLVGNVFGFSSFGQLSAGQVSAYGLFGFDMSTATGFLTAVIANILLTLVVGVITSVATMFSEIAWRGFLPRHIHCGRYLLPLVIGALWTLWEAPNLVCAQPVLSAVMVLIKNIALSYFLMAVVQKIGSVWISSAAMGIIATGMIVPLYDSYSSYASTVTTVAAAITLWLLSLALHKTTGSKTPN